MPFNKRKIEKINTALDAKWTLKILTNSHWCQTPLPDPYNVNWLLLLMVVVTIMMMETINVTTLRSITSRCLAVVLLALLPQ